MTSTDVEGLPPLVAQGRLIEAIARSVHGAADPRWTTIELRAIVLAPVSSVRMRVTVDGTVEQPLPPEEVDDLVEQLRDVMYRDGAGTWFTFVMTITAPAAVTSRFEYDEEPGWTADVDPVAYVTDQHRYPRDVDRQPAWLRDRLAEGWARIHDLDPARRPAWVERQLDAGTHVLTPTGLAELP